MTTVPEICDQLVHWLNETDQHHPNWSPEVWETFQFACQVHGIAPLLHEKLKGTKWLDKSIKAWLAEQYAFNVQRLNKMHAELKEILALFGQHGIRLMPLKGSVLSVECYEDPGWRPMADLDLLIRPADFNTSARLLADLGYEPEVKHWKHTEFSRPDNRQVVSTTGEHPDNPRKLELHLHCRESFGGPTVDLTATMWANSVTGELLGESAIIVRPEALWLHLLVHTTYHLWQGRGRLIHLIDLVKLTPQLQDPVRMLHTVDARYSYPSLVLLRKYFPTELYESLLSAQRTKVSGSFQGWADSLDLVNTSYLNPKPAGLYVARALKFTEGRPHEVGQALRFAMLPNLEEIVLDHPRLAKSRLPWLAYFLLPLDWARRLVRR